MTSTVGLVEVLKNIHCPSEGLRHLLDTIPSTRRVMHQMCMEGILNVQVYSILTDIGEVDLAFRLAVSQGMWDNVQQLSWEPAVSERSRLLALRTAIGQENWTMVQKLGWARVHMKSENERATTRSSNLWADNPDSKQKKRVYRKAFRELVHHDQLFLALQMLPGYLNKVLGHRFLHFFRPRKSDLELAVEFCLGHPDRCDMAVQFLVKSRRVPSLVLWTRLITVCIEEGKVKSLLPLSYYNQLICNIEWPEYLCILFELALKAGHAVFVRDFCSPFLKPTGSCIQNAGDKATDLEIVDELIVEASSQEYFYIVIDLLPFCSQKQEVLFQLLEVALGWEQWQILEAILTGETVDPCLFFGYNCDENTLLNQALGHWGSIDNLCLTSEKEHLVRLCIRTGVSTYERASHSCQGVNFDKYRNVNGSNAWSARYLHRSPFKRTIESKANLSTAKLLYQSGATSYEELHDLKCDDSFTSTLDQENRDYLNDVASTPRTLQDTCRLRVSHLIGCRPGRASRVESLPIPTFAKDLVLFKDITRGWKSPWTRSLQ